MPAKRAPGYAGLGFPDPRRLALIPDASTDSQPALYLALFAIMLAAALLLVPGSLLGLVLGHAGPGPGRSAARPGWARPGPAGQERQPGRAAQEQPHLGDTCGSALPARRKTGRPPSASCRSPAAARRRSRWPSRGPRRGRRRIPGTARARSAAGRPAPWRGIPPPSCPAVAGAAAGRRVHGDQGQDLQQVVLDHVAQRADGIVEPAAALDAEVLGHRDLHGRDARALPQLGQRQVSEPQVLQLDDRFLGEEVIDAQDLALAQQPVQPGWERLLRNPPDRGYGRFGAVEG